MRRLPQKCFTLSWARRQLCLARCCRGVAKSMRLQLKNSSAQNAPIYSTEQAGMPPGNYDLNRKEGVDDIVRPDKSHQCARPGPLLVPNQCICIHASLVLLPCSRKRQELTSTPWLQCSRQLLCLK